MGRIHDYSFVFLPGDNVEINFRSILSYMPPCSTTLSLKISNHEFYPNYTLRWIKGYLDKEFFVQNYQAFNFLWILKRNA